VDVSEFPVIKFLVETKEKTFTNTQVYVPLRVPGRSGFVYESFCRVMRLTEIPSPQGDGNRKFLEFEWRFDENPLLESEHHAMFSFMSGEVECPACKALFIPETNILDESSIRITCPNCMHYWTLKVDSPAIDEPSLRMLTDSFYKKPTEIRKLMDSWASPFGSTSDSTYRAYFPVEFENHDAGGSLEWLFGERQTYLKKSLVDQGDFEVISKGFINYLTLKYFQDPAKAQLRSNLETTEICHKTDIQVKRDEAQKKFVTEFLQGASEGALEKATEEVKNQEAPPSQDYDPFKHMTEPMQSNTVIKEMPISIYQPREKERVVRSIPVNVLVAGISFLASLLFIGSIFGYFVYQKKAEEQSREVAFQEEVKKKLQQTQTKSTPEKSKFVDKMLAGTPEVIAAKAAAVDSPKAIEPVNAPVELEEKNFEQTVSEKIAEDIREQPKMAETEAIEEEAPDVVVEPEGTPQKNLAKLALVKAGFRQASLYLKMNQHTEAVAELKKVLELDPTHKLSHRNLGLAYINLGEKSKARQAFETYLNLAEKSPSAADKDIGSIRQILRELKK
jgi:predicted negative regulator of RcsB-dependent stress response